MLRVISASAEFSNTALIRPITSASLQSHAPKQNEAGCRSAGDGQQARIVKIGGDNGSLLLLGAAQNFAVRRAIQALLYGVNGIMAVIP